MSANMSNSAFSAQDWFKSLCEKAGIPATARQASKYRRNIGLAKWTEQHPNGYEGKYTSMSAREKTREESLDGQRIQGRNVGSAIMDYGPYSQYNEEPSPHPKTKCLPPAFQKRNI